MLIQAQDGFCSEKVLSYTVQSEEQRCLRRTARACDRLLALLNEHHNYNVPKGITRKDIIEIKAADDELVERLEVCVLPIPVPKITADAIKRIVCKHFNVSHGEMISPRRDHKVLKPRMIAMYLTKEFTALSLPAIGRHFGKRDHTTALHSIKRVMDCLAANDPIASDVHYLRGMLSV